jgi:hypothetical protein
VLQTGKNKKEKCGEQIAALCLLYLIERRLFIRLERFEKEIFIFQDGGQVEIKKKKRSPTSMGKQYPMLVTFPTPSILIVAFK